MWLLLLARLTNLSSLSRKGSNVVQLAVSIADALGDAMIADAEADAEPLGAVMQLLFHSKKKTCLG